jgi:hypothetical protein
MLKILTDEAAIGGSYRRFLRSLKPSLDERIAVELSHPGASFRARIAWSNRLGIWIYTKKTDGKYWNAFGVGRPRAKTNVPMTCEVNFPLRGIDRRIGGAFAKDGSGRVFVLHRGKLGGGRRGVGKSLFEERFRGTWAFADDGGVETAAAVIGCLSSPSFARQMAQFVRKVVRLKESAAPPDPQMELGLGEIRFREEEYGEREPACETDLAASCERSLIVRDLADALIKQGYGAANDDRWDLSAVDVRGEIRAAFAVADTASPADIRTAVGRLLLGGAGARPAPGQYLVLPAGTPGELQERLRLLNIEILHFHRQDDRTVFDNRDFPPRHS